MKTLYLMLIPLASTGCSLRPNHTVYYATSIPDRDTKVIYDQRVPNPFGGEEDVYVQLADAREFRIDRNGRFSKHLHLSVSRDGSWYRFYLKDRYSLVGHVAYRNIGDDGELSRYWVSQNEDTQKARSHPYAILAFLNTSTGKLYRDNGDFGFSTTAERDYFGSKTSLPSRQRLLGDVVDWLPMERQDPENEMQNQLTPNL